MANANYTYSVWINVINDVIEIWLYEINTPSETVLKKLYCKISEFSWRYDVEADELRFYSNGVESIAFPSANFTRVLNTADAGSTDDKINFIISAVDLPTSSAVEITNIPTVLVGNTVDVNLTNPTSSIPDALIDPFGNLYTSQWYPLFESKFNYSLLPELWDSVYTGAAPTRSNSVCYMTSSAGGYSIRQTFQRFGYQPGKTKRILMTVSNFHYEGNSDIKRIGAFSSATSAPYNTSFDGIYMESNSTGRRICIARNGTVDSYEQAQWLDQLNGSGAAGFVDFDKSNIYEIQFQWLGYGVIRWFVYTNTGKHKFFEQSYTNLQVVPYMNNPDINVRLEVRNQAKLSYTCVSVDLAGVKTVGIPYSSNTGAAGLNLTTSGTRYAVGIFDYRTGYQNPIEFNNIDLFTPSNTEYMYEIVLNGTISPSIPARTQINGSSLQNVWTSSRTISGGTILASGYGRRTTNISKDLNALLRLGRSIAGVSDTLTIAITPLSNNSTIYCAIEFIEYI